MKRTTLSLIFALSVTFLTYGHSVKAGCNSTPSPDGNDTYVCTGDNLTDGPSGPAPLGLGGGGGSDTIIVEEGANVVEVAGDGQGQLGGVTHSPNSSAPDTIIIAGNVGHVYGDLGNFNGANDTITITSTGHVGNISGDIEEAPAGPPQHMGNDTITVDAGAVVNSNVDGDGFKGYPMYDTSGGGDNITINGSVGGDVNGQLGNDTITVGGTVGGTVDGGVGDDKITLNKNANGGADNNLAVNGGDGNDTLTFAFTITSEDDYNALASLISANTSSGSITINGQTITWSNFEQLINALIANFGVGSRVTFKDNRINQSDAGASALAYCTGSGVQVLGVNPTTAQGSEAFTVTTAQIQAALAEAKSTASNVEITTAAGITLAATPDGKLVVTAPDISDASKIYQFSFDTKLCG